MKDNPYHFNTTDGSPQYYTPYQLAMPKRTLDELVLAAEMLRTQLKVYLDDVDTPYIQHPHIEGIVPVEHEDKCMSIDCKCIMGTFRRLLAIKRTIQERIKIKCVNFAIVNKILTD